MKVYAGKKPTESSVKKRGFCAKPASLSSVVGIPAFAPDVPVLQRKMGCACGGGCPRCSGELRIQPKLKIGAPGDRYEQEADRVADQVMSMPEPRVQRQVETDEEEEEPTIQTRPLASTITPLVQRRTELEEKEEEPVQAKLRAKSVIQRQAEDGEEEEEEPLQAKVVDNTQVQQQATEEEEQSEELPIQTMLVQRQATEEEPEEETVKQAEEEEDELAQTKPMGKRLFAGRETPIQPKCACAQTPQVPPAVAANIQALKGGGRPLPQATRAFFEPRFGADFSQVRVHTDFRAAEAASSIQAKAFTAGQNIAFGTGRYAPHSQEGRRLLAHELTHVVQQNGRQSQRAQSLKTGETLQVPSSLGPDAKMKGGAETPGKGRSAFGAHSDGLARCGLGQGEVISRGPDDLSNSRKLRLNFLYSSVSVHEDTQDPLRPMRRRRTRTRSANIPPAQLLRPMSFSTPGAKADRNRHAAPIIAHATDRYEIEADRSALKAMSSFPGNRAGVVTTTHSLEPQRQSKLSPGLRRDIAQLRRGGRALSRLQRDFFEPRFGASFAQVRIHSNARAQDTARAIRARAFTVGRSIVFGAGQYRPETVEGAHLLAHELAHVAQQARARSRVPVIQRAPPTVRKRAKPRIATPAEIQATLVQFLREVKASQPGKGLGDAPEVSDGLKLLCGNHFTNWYQIQHWLRGPPSVPDDPVRFAQQAAKRLPKQIGVDVLEALLRMPRGPSKPSRLQKLRGVLKPKTPPQGPSRAPPRGPSSQQRSRQGVKQVRKHSGKRPIKEYGPYMAPIGKGVQWIKDRKAKAARAEAARRAAASPGKRPTYPALEKDIGLIRSDALIPAPAARKLAWAKYMHDIYESAETRKQLEHAQGKVNSYANNAKEVARDLAWRLDRAHRQGKTRAQLRLGGNYLKVRNRKTIYSELDRIVSIVRNRLPHRASRVRIVEVYFGQTLVRFIKLAKPATKAR